ncbi:hypothetical protein LPJ74_000534 [Coemansia sp. RSA 1843]|nr:hypothetical protein LPJ74_000534 [Coemansia sp. RSA 1843]
MSMRSSGSSRGSNSSSGSEYESESGHVPNKRQKVQDDPDESETEGSSANINLEELDSIEHEGRVYYVGDHTVLKDTDNISGTEGTGLPAVAHIQSIQREKDSSVSVTVAWYVLPQLSPHPLHMEFYKDTVLRTFRETTVPVDCIIKKCFVVHPSDARTGHPSEWTEADGDMFVCDSRFVDKGAFIQKIKHWNRGFWPDSMDEDRRKMLTTMIPWEGGPRELERAPVPVQTGEDDNAHTPQTRRTTRMTATPKSNEPTPHNGGAASAAAFPQTPTPATSSQAQLFAYQQLLSQGRINMPAGLNGQAPPSFMLPGANINQEMLNQQQQQQIQLLQQQQQLQNAALAGLGSPTGQQPIPNPFMQPAQARNGTIPNQQFQPPPTPKRRGRPPKNKQLIQQRAMEDAAAAAAAVAAAGGGGGGSMGGVPNAGYVKIAQAGVRTPSRPRTPTTPISSTPQRQHSMFSNMGRPPPSPAVYNGVNGMTPSIQRMPSASAGQMQAMYQPNQMVAGRVQNGAQMSQSAAHASQQQQVEQFQRQQVKQATVEYLPYADPSSSTPQLPKELIDMFPTTNGQIKWFAAAPVLRKANADIQHSDSYLQWANKSKQSYPHTNGYNHGGVDTESMDSDA